MTTRRRILAGAAGLAASSLAVPPLAFARSSPEVARIILGFPAGGSNDAIARLLAARIQPRYAPSVIVENRAGAGGRIGVEAVKRAAADGSAILQTPGSILTLYPHIYKSLAYDALRDFKPVTVACTLDFALVTSSAANPARTIGQYVDWCKADPRHATYGSPATGASPHFVGLMLGKSAGFEMLHVGYKGAAPAVQDLLGGQIPAYVGMLADVVPHLHSGKLRVLATSGAKRAAATPEVPTFQEAGFEDLSLQEWYGLLLPAAAPDAMVDALNKSLEQALREPDVVERLKALTVEAAPTSPALFAERIARETAKWRQIVKATGFKMMD